MTLTEIKSQLRTLDIQPSKGLGQNFLYDQNLARGFADRVQPEIGGCIVEVGPGLGSLTEYLVDRRSHVIAIERDSRMATYLREKFSLSELEIIRADATRYDIRNLYGRGPIRIIGNLPYSVSTPLIDLFTSELSPAQLLVLGVQKELAERLCAVPRTKAYGAMTVRMQRQWNIQIVHKLPASVFFPQPKVESAIIEMRRRNPDELPDCDVRVFDELVRLGFSERRKQMHKLLGRYRLQWEEASSALGISKTARAEELSIRQWIELTRLLKPLPAAQMLDEKLMVVDLHDQGVDVQSRHQVHVNNLRHRAVHILVFNAQNELFLQKRSLRKDRNPGLWDSSAAGHVGAGDSYEDAAKRELQEELGIHAVLEFVTKLPASSVTGEEFISVYRAIYDGALTLARSEIETGTFFPLGQIQQWMRDYPNDFTPTCRMCVEAIL